MSHYYNHRQKTRRPFFLRAWLLVPLLVLGIAGLAGTWKAWDFLKVYKERAAGFDVELIREMDSASIILDRKGKPMGRIFVHNRDAIPLSQLPSNLIQAVIAAEDNRFYQHKGVDTIGMLRAAVTNYKAGEIKQGGSTLTMQLARNTFSLLERSYERKLVEVFLALRVEQHFSKNEILELYLNRVYYGSGFYGAEAAARGYFGKSAKDLTLSESAILAGLLRSPNNLSPWANRSLAIRERNIVLGRMLELSMITPEQHAAAVSEEPAVKNRRPISSENYLLDYIRQQVVAKLGFERAVSEGLRIHTTIDSEIQQHAEKVLGDRILAVERRQGFGHPTYSDYEQVYLAHQRRLRADPNGAEAEPLEPPAYLQGALLQIHNPTGGVLAMVGGRNFRHSEYNRTVQGRRPPGTAVKPLIYAAAYENGLYPGYLLDDSPLDNRQVMIGGTTGILGEWGPENETNRFEGRITAQSALAQSKNSATVRLGMEVGMESAFQMIADAGITSEMRPFPASYLGSSEVSLAELTNAFTAFARGGERMDAPYVIDRIVDKAGNVVFRANPRRVEVMRDTVAWQVHESLSDSLVRGSADKARSQFGLRQFDGGGKTGTAYNFTDLWFVGYNSEVTTGVWVGFDRPLMIYRGAFSSDIALPIWVDVMNASLDTHRPAAMKRPLALKQIELCRSTGLAATAECHAAATAASPENPAEGVYVSWIDPFQTPASLCPTHNEGVTMMAQTPRGGNAPRAMPALDLASIEPVVMRAPTITGDSDPYSSVTPESMLASRRAAVFGGDGMEVRRAEPVRPFDQPFDTPVLQLEPPKPLEF